MKAATTFSTLHHTQADGIDLVHFLCYVRPDAVGTSCCSAWPSRAGLNAQVWGTSCLLERSKEGLICRSGIWGRYLEGGVKFAQARQWKTYSIAIGRQEMI